MNLYQGFQLYLQEQSIAEIDKRMVKTMLLRYLVPAFAGPEPSGARISATEELAALNYLKQITLISVDQLTERMNLYFEQIQLESRIRNKQRYYLKKLISWFDEENFLQKENVGRRVLGKVKFRNRNGSGTTMIVPKLGKTPRAKYILDREELIKAGNITLIAELEGFQRWQIDTGRCRANSSLTERRDKDIRRFLGWLHKFEGVPLETLSASSIVQVVKRPPRDSFPNTPQGELEWEAADKYAKALAKRVAIEDLERLKKYLGFYSNNKRSRSSIADVICVFAQYVYRDEIAYFSISDDEDEDVASYVPSIVKRLHKFRKQEAPSDDYPYAVDQDEKFVPYQDALEVVYKLKEMADEPLRLDGYPRTSESIAQSFMHFLVLALLCLLPPERQQVIRCLKLGETFSKGHVIRSKNRGKFIPIEKMENPSKAVWCFNIPAEMYKTGKKYGDFIIPLYNFIFDDGTTLYQYIDEWVDIHRPVLNPKDDYLLIGTRTGRQLNATRVWQVVRTAFLKFTGKPVNPHMLRKIYRTFLKQIAAPSYIQSLAAKSMKHSDKMADDIYNLALLEEELRPVFEFNQRVLNELRNLHNQDEKAS